MSRFAGDNLNLGELAGKGVDLSRASMLLDDDVVSDWTGQGQCRMGLVVEEGIEQGPDLTSGGMPVPLSRIVISTRSPRFLLS